jgi:hypothetical protein
MDKFNVKSISQICSAKPAVLALLLILCGCAGPLFGNRLDVARNIAEEAGMVEFRTDVGEFVLTGYRSRHRLANSIALYIEGDGFAFESRTRPSADPTPKDPVGLRLAAVATRHTSQDTAVVYLARPCHYLRGDGDVKRCSVHYWTLHRFAPEVIQAYRNALKSLKSQLGATAIELYGYSGGGTVAALLAGSMDGVTSLTTFAAVLDLDKWAEVRSLTPLAGSLNPAETNGLARVPQTHYIGEDDERVPLVIAQSYVSRIGGMAEKSLFLAPNVDHDCCWDRFWSSGFEGN